MYTDRNFRTKKELKEAVAQRQRFLQSNGVEVIKGRAVTVFQPNSDITEASVPRDGKVHLEGPHYPEPHRWYAEAWLKDGEIVKVR